jgi:hypothetical protein
MKKESDVFQALKQFAKVVGAPEALVCDAAKAQKSEAVKKFCNEIGTTLRVLEENTPWANKAELYIGLIKEAVRKDMKDSDCPIALWDYCVERRARINNLTARSLFSLHGMTPHTALTGEEGDISNLCRYGWYEWCYYRDKGSSFPFASEVLGRVLGPASGEGNEMAQWILKANGNVVPRRTARPLNIAEINSSTEIDKRRMFDGLVVKRWGTSMSPAKLSKSSDNESVGAETLETVDEWEEYSDDDEDARVVPESEDTVDATGRLIDQQPAYDQIINAKVLLQ